MPETWAAAFALLFFAVIVSMNPFNGIAFILISTPFFLGETGWPYYWTLEALVFGTLLSAITHAWIRKEKFVFPLKYQVILLIVAAAASLPIDGKEFYYEFWTATWNDMFAWWLSGHPAPKINYLRVLVNMLSGIGLFLVAFNFASKRDAAAILPSLKATVVVAGAVCVIGILMFYGMIPKNPDTWHYLTLSVVGKFGSAITAFSYALHFWNQYLLLVLPLVLYFIFFKRNEPKALLFYIAILGVVTFCLLQGGLRSAAMLFYLTVLLAAGLYFYSTTKGKLHGNKYLIIVGLVAVAAIGAAFLTRGEAFARLYDEILKKFNYETLKGIPEFIDNPLYFLEKGISEPRFFLWHTAVMMFIASPFLGIGLGRYTALFKEYYASDWYNWEYIGFASGASSHSIYFEILANQGIIGLLVWGLLLASILIAGVKAIRSETAKEKKALIIAILFSIVSWLLLGVTHHIALCRVIEIFFWIQAGILAGLSSSQLKHVELRKRIFAGTLIVISIAFIYQIKLISDRPVSEQFSTGFYNWEGLPDGSPARWAGKRAVMNVKIESEQMVVSLSAPLPSLDKNPQKITIWFGSHKTEAVFRDTSWQDIIVPADATKGSYKALWMEADYVFNPKKKNISSDDRNLGVMMKQIRWE